MVDLERTAQRLFDDVMVPLVIGGELAPVRAIGAPAALALGDRFPPVGARASAVAAARLRRARRIAAVDRVPNPRASDWALAAAFHDIVLSANPGFDTPLRRNAAERILAGAMGVLERIGPPATTAEALTRHTWLARVLEIHRTDTTVSWWAGSQTFRGFAPPARLMAWPELRRVRIAETSVPLLELSPLAPDRTRFMTALFALLESTPLTDLATCWRPEPAFEWRESTLRLLSDDAGRTLALRAVDAASANLDGSSPSNRPGDRVPFASSSVDAAFGRATRDLLSRVDAARIRAVLRLLAERALAVATSDSELLDASPPSADASLARSLGAQMAHHVIASGPVPWRHVEGDRVLGRLSKAAPQAADASLAAALLARATS